MNVWLEAARPRTLPAAVAPVLVGTGAAIAVGAPFSGWRVLGTLVVTLAIQVAVNYANDYFDGVSGIDTPDRVGPRRAVASGLVRPPQMRTAIGLAVGVAVTSGLAVAAAAGWELVVVGAVCVAAALAYSGGPRPYASAGLGEVFTFVFFGLVATVGSAYVQAERVVAVAVAAAVPVGLLVTAILVANNLRDVPTDATVGKRTLAVRLGEQRTRGLFAALVWGAYLLGVALVLPAARSPWPLLALGSVPLALPVVGAVGRGASGLALLPVLAGTARLELVYSALLTVGLTLS